MSNTTNELTEILLNAKTNAIHDVINENESRMATGDRPFYNYMKARYAAKGYKVEYIYGCLGFSNSYGGALLRMEKHTKDRDKIIRLCMAGRFNFEETQRALKLYGMKQLYAREKRDAVLIVAINNKKFDVEEVNKLLASEGCELMEVYYGEE